MDIRVTSTNKTFFEVDNGIGAVLLEAFPTVFERAIPALSKPVKYSQTVEVATAPADKVETRHGKREATFALGRNNQGILVLVCRVRGGEVIEYLNPPAGAKQAFERAGFQVPEEILKDYELAYKNEHCAVTSRPANVRRA